MTYRLALKAEGPNYLYWQTIDQLIGIADIPVNPDSSFTPQTDVAQSLSGMTYPRGFSQATWHFAGLTVEQRQILRSFCPAPALSAEVYIETATNEQTVCGDDEFIQCSAILHWVANDEEIQAGRVLGLDLLFTHLVDVP